MTRLVYFLKVVYLCSDYQSTALRTIFLIYVFVTLYLIAMLRPIAPLVEYAINYDYIAKILCVNKENLSLNCNGKCYVMKKLQKQQEEDFNSIQIIMKDYPIGFVELIGVTKIKDTTWLQKKLPFYKRIYTYLASFSVFHPPKI